MDLKCAIEFAEILSTAFDAQDYVEVYEVVQIFNSKYPEYYMECMWADYSDIEPTVRKLRTCHRIFQKGHVIVMGDGKCG